MTDGRPSFSVTFGAMAPPLHEQLKQLRGSLDPWQRDADAITRLSVHGYLTEAQVHKARKKLMKALTVKLAKGTDD
jgi:hypothetical protein